MDNRFFVFEDEQIRQMDDFTIPNEWWSRPFEYAFATKFLNENDVICDAGCGIEHPFKFYASSRVKEVTAIDIDSRLLEFKSVEGLKFANVDLKDIGKRYKGYFDKLFCISVLEHDIPNLEENLKSFEMAIKGSGLIILTMDYPLIKPETVLNMLDNINLQVVGEIDYREPERMLRGYYSNLSCFSMILEKKVKEIEINDKKEVKPKKKKPFKPSETK